jgi:bacteriocin biosynthesis cyclodehydratase domain-containing protein
LSATAGLFAALHPGEAILGAVPGSLESRRVAVVGSGAAAAEVARLLRQSGVDVRREETISTDVDLTVCAPAPAQLPLLGDWNRQALASRQAWLQVLPFDGRYAAIGPLYLPDETACFECFRLRRLANLEAGDELDVLDASPAAYPAAPALQALLAGFAAILALRWLILRDHYVPAAFYSLELEPALALNLHHVHRVPRCPVCSGLDDVAGPLPWHKEHAGVGD